MDKLIEGDADMTTIMQLWQHVGSGEQFAVKVDELGNVIEACGPLYYSYVDQALAGDFDSDQELVDDLNSDSEHYNIANDQRGIESVVMQ